MVFRNIAYEPAKCVALGELIEPIYRHRHTRKSSLLHVYQIFRKTGIWSISHVYAYIYITPTLARGSTSFFIVTQHFHLKPRRNLNQFNVRKDHVQTTCSKAKSKQKTICYELNSMSVAIIHLWFIKLWNKWCFLFMYAGMIMAVSETHVVI